jgi:hypothetical protein
MPPEPCALGTYSTEEGIASQRECTKCPAGWFGTAAGQATLADGCTKCGAGLFSDKEGVAQDDAASPPPCTPCPGGTYQSEEGGTSEDCRMCPPGTYSNATLDLMVSEDQCIACAAGEFCPEGSAAPQPCPAGTFSDAEGAHECAVCSAGSFCSAGANATTPCALGTYSTEIGIASQRECSKCPAGWVGKAEGQSNQTAGCEPCERGNFSDKEGAAAAADGSPPCLPCPGGTFQSSDQGATSADCEPWSARPPARPYTCSIGRGGGRRLVCAHVAELAPYR